MQRLPSGRHAAGREPRPPAEAGSRRNRTAPRFEFPRFRFPRFRFMTVAAVVFAVAAASLALGLGLKPTVLHARETADTPSARSAASDPAETAKDTPRFTPAISRPSAFPRHHAAKRRHHAPATTTPSPPATPSGATSPLGVANPSPSDTPSAAASTGDGSSWPTSVPGWQLTYSTDFPGNSLPSGWDAYKGRARRRPPRQLGALQRDGQRRRAEPAGNALGPGRRGVLREPADLRHVPGPDEGRRRAGAVHQQPGHLVPAQQGVWPPEVDYFQDAGGTRQSFSASLHVGPDGNGDCCVIPSPTQDNDGTAWHTYGVQWTPSSMTYTIDGRPGPASPAIR